MRNEVEANYSTALKLWWALIWRTVPLAMAGAFVIGLVLGIIVGVTGLGLSPIVSGVFGLVWGAFASVWVIKRLMTKGFGNYRLAILEK